MSHIWESLWSVEALGVCKLVMTQMLQEEQTWEMFREDEDKREEERESC